ncbi:hypothetical protein ABK040_009144 [Willaertia magna]
MLNLFFLNYLEICWERDLQENVTKKESLQNIQKDNFFIHSSLIENLKNNNEINLEIKNKEILREIQNFKNKNLQNNFINKIFNNTLQNNLNNNELEEYWINLSDIYSIKSLQNKFTKQSQLLKYILCKTFLFENLNNEMIDFDKCQSKKLENLQKLKERINKFLIFKRCFEIQVHGLNQMTTVKDKIKNDVMTDVKSWLSIGGDWIDNNVTSLANNKEEYVNELGGNDERMTSDYDVNFEVLPSLEFIENFKFNFDENNLKETLQQALNKMKEIYQNLIENDQQIKEKLNPKKEFPKEEYIKKFKYKKELFHFYKYVIYYKIIPNIENERLNKLNEIIYNLQNKITKNLLKLFKYCKQNEDIYYKIISLLFYLKKNNKLLKFIKNFTNLKQFKIKLLNEINLNYKNIKNLPLQKDIFHIINKYIDIYIKLKKEEEYKQLILEKCLDNKENINFNEILLHTL